MKNTTSPRPFWVNLLMILGTVTLIALAAFLFSQSFAIISNVYFISSVLLWIVAIIPAFTEIGGNTKIRYQARKGGKSAREIINAQEGKYQRGGRQTFLFGLAGFICFLLAFVSLAL